MSIVEKALTRLQAATAPHEPHEPRAPLPRQVARESARERSTGRSTAQPKRDRSVADRVSIPMDKLQAALILPPADATHRAADEMRRIKWPLFNDIFGPGSADMVNGNLLQVTSSVPGEGKTYTSINLALTAAREGDCDILLLDADLLKPWLSNLLGVSGRPGLIDLLADSSLALERTLLGTDIDGLYVIPAGRGQARGGEFAGINRLHETLERIAHEFRGGVVIVDSPPLLSASLAQNLSRSVGHLLMVVRALETPRAIVQEALSLIDRPSIVSCVLNQAPAIAHGGSSYGGYYGYAAGDEQR